MKETPGPNTSELLRIRQENTLLRTLLENTPDVIARFDRNGRRLYVNAAVRWSTGVPAEEYIGKHISEPPFFGGRAEVANRVAEKIFRVFADGTGDSLEFAYGSPPAAQFFHTRIVPERNADGTVVSVLTISHDITDRKQAEEALRSAKMEADAANRAKSDFLAHMSHEIRTPIGGIMGVVDMLGSRIRDPEQRSYLALVKDAAESLLSIIGDILDLSRIESGQVDLECVDCETETLLDSVISPLRLAAKEKGLTLALHIAEDVPRCIRADKEKIAQVLRNLLSNAVKYTERGSIRVAVERGENDGRGDIRLRFRISDTGVGIPAEKHESIFGSFVRLRGSVNERNAEGAGLGLTICRRLTELLGGTLQVESAAGQGSTFTFSVDADVVETMCAEEPAAAVSDIGSLSPLRILLVEDNAINQIFVSTVLTDAGHSVTVAGNGKEALAALESAPDDGGFDLVLMDVQMPVMDGIEATRRIRRMTSSVSCLPIVALTAFAMKGDEERFLAAGMNGYVTKPIDWSSLAAVIRNLPEK